MYSFRAIERVFLSLSVFELECVAILTPPLGGGVKWRRPSGAPSHPRPAAGQPGAGGTHITYHVRGTWHPYPGAGEYCCHTGDWVMDVHFCGIGKVGPDAAICHWRPPRLQPSVLFRQRSGYRLAGAGPTLERSSTEPLTQRRGTCPGTRGPNRLTSDVFQVAADLYLLIGYH